MSGIGSTLDCIPASHAWPTHQRDVRAVIQVLEALARSDLRDSVAVRGAWCFQFWFGQMPRMTRGLDLALVSPSAEAAPPVRDILASLKRPDIHVDATSLRDTGGAWTARTMIDLRIRCGGSWAPLRVALAHNVADAQHVESLRAPGVGPHGATLAVSCLTREWMVAEKAALLVTYGPDHTRLKDILDIWFLQRSARFDAAALVDVFGRVFAGRDAARMLLRSDGYWEAALDRRRLARQQLVAWETIAYGAVHPIPGLPNALDEVASFLFPVFRKLRLRQRFPSSWHASSGWMRRAAPGWRRDTGQPSLLRPPLMDRVAREAVVPDLRATSAALKRSGSPEALHKRHMTTNDTAEYLGVAPETMAELSMRENLHLLPPAGAGVPTLLRADSVHALGQRKQGTLMKQEAEVILGVGRPTLCQLPEDGVLTTLPAD
jgi:hypothetical protein